MENTQSKIKPIKVRKELGTTYCLGSKDFSDNFGPQVVKTTKKVLREKYNILVYQSNKSSQIKTKTQ